LPAGEASLRQEAGWQPALRNEAIPSGSLSPERKRAGTGQQLRRFKNGPAERAATG